MQPILGHEALARGAVTRADLLRHHRAVYRDVYLPAGVAVTAALRARAAWLSVGRTATLVGISAAAVHGTPRLDPRWPAELVGARGRRQAAIVCRRYDLAGDEVCRVDGMTVSTPARTAFDIGRSRPGAEALPILAALMDATGLTPGEVLELAGAKSGVRGLRRVTELMCRLESAALPMSAAS
ncbi:hypothetical protein [Mycolicibacterium palauense]|uniref:hypothetical protein n=1 Tax=Mycolicibacterium palauense TaxID=2034511 RepID=UPI000BFF0C2D|nr:hypothetical protein [Mycolicibacterium palauense]